MNSFECRDLAVFFNPKSIALVGVSSGPSSFGGASFLHRFIEAGFSGTIYPINPRAPEIMGLKAWPNLSSLPRRPDLAIIAVQAAAVPDTLEECARLGIRHIHILSAGFGEIGTEQGRELEGKVAAIGRDRNLLIIGPNCMGPYAPAARLTAWGAVPGRDGRLGIISQSGGITQRLTEFACSLGVGVSKAVSIGNAAILDSPDFLEFMAKDDAIRVIALYLENIRDGRRLFELARAASPIKPMIMMKGGESERGAATVASHTGRMAGDAGMWRAFFAQTGVIQVAGMNEWMDTLLAFSCLPKPTPEPAAEGVFIVGGGGGNSVIFSDTCIREGLSVPTLSPRSMDKIRPIVPAAGSIAGNPLDLWEAFLRTDRLFSILEIAYDDPHIGMVVVDRLIPRIAFHSPQVPDTLPEIVDFIRSRPRAKPTVFVIDYDGGDPDLIAKGSLMRSRFCEAGIPAYPSFERAVKALANYRNYRKRLLTIGNKWLQ
jgi:acyl-CoA synthetase (NDP forming)